MENTAAARGVPKRAVKKAAMPVVVAMRRSRSSKPKSRPAR